jgi:hypothetical protein
MLAPDRKLQMRGEVLGRGAVPALAPAWQDLCSRAIEDNVYYYPRYARALIDNIDRDQHLQLAVVWEQANLVALLPFSRALIQTPLLGSAARAWRTKYTFNCMPLLDRTCAIDASARLIDVLSTVNQAEWIIPLAARRFCCDPRRS